MMAKKNPLENVKKGMKVYDSAGHEVGKVEYVHFGDEVPGSPIPKTEGISPAVEEKQDSLFQDVARALSPDNLPENLKARLLREGFIRVDAPGLFKADRYIFPNQIQGVSSDGVTLKINQKQVVSEK